MSLTALTGAAIFDGAAMHHGKVLVIDGMEVAEIAKTVPDGATITPLGGGLIAPGFVDLQVNGGGGLMLNDAPSIDTLRHMAAAHLRGGTTSFLPTLITDTADITRTTITATIAACAKGVPGLLGLHLEGPHLSVARKGAHDATLIRPMEEADLALYRDAARRLPILKMTLAPETVAPDEIAKLTDAGILVSLGHTDASAALCQEAVAAGARCVTHLFNAMRQLGSREPGVVGATLDCGNLSAGLIADGIHVHPATIRAALAAKRGPGEIFLVTDAMAGAGTDQTTFALGGRRILRQNRRLTLEDGTLAGADLDIPRALRIMVDSVGATLDQALAMATSIPARLIGAPAGTLCTGARADIVYLDEALNLVQVWASGQKQV